MTTIKVEAFAVIGADDVLVTIRHTKKEAKDVAKSLSCPDYYYLWGPDDQQDPPIMVAYIGATVRKCTISFDAKK